MQQDYAIVAHKETMKQFIAPHAESGNRKITKSMLSPKVSNTKKTVNASSVASQERYYASKYCRLHFIAGIAKGNGITVHFYEALLQKFESANFRCFYTGVPLVPGINACVVHL